MNKVEWDGANETKELFQGDVFLSGGVYYMLSAVDSRKYALISLSDGNRYRDVGSLDETVRDARGMTFVGRGLKFKISK